MSNRNSIVAGWVVIALILCQFVPRNRAPSPSPTPASIPAGPRAVLFAHCFRCHSNETKWPASAYIAPLSWFVAREVHKARNAINFSNYQKQPPELRENVRQRIHRIALSGRIPGHAPIPGFPKIGMGENEQRLLLEWSSDVTIVNPNGPQKNSGPARVPEIRN